MFLTMRDNGFSCQRSRTYSSFTHERREIVLQRYIYLDRVEKARQEGRWILSGRKLGERQSQVDERDGKCGLGHAPPHKKKSGKRTRSILCRVGSADDPNGFLKASFLLFRGSKSSKRADYHTEMNADEFIDWIKTEVVVNLPRLPVKCALVIDRAPYHMTCTPETAPPSSSANKGELVDYCEKRGILIPQPGWEGGRPPSVAYRVARMIGSWAAQGVIRAHLWM